MTKNDFLDKLKLALNGNVSASLVQENLAYYNEYIDSQIRSGRSEQDVLDMLGDPRLIAKTIVQTNGKEAAEDADYRESSSYDKADYDNYNTSDNHPRQNTDLKIKTIPGWLWTVLTVVIIVCVISFIFSLVSFLLPLVLPILIVLFFVKLFRDWLN